MRSHGLPATYNAGCRCAPCRKASVAYLGERRRRANERAREHFERTGTHYVARTGPHGTPYTYAFRGCRCIECRAWHARQTSSARRRRGQRTQE